MEEDIYEEDAVLLINDLKIKWFTLLSRVDTSPTIDETVLTSLNSIANLLISNRPANASYDILFEAALRLGVFESIFRWNFLFCGADLEAFKAKELQFYDTLITGDGKQYLRYPEFVIPLLATLHHCAIRSSLPVERVLVRTLNSACAAMCAQFTESMETRDPAYSYQRNCSTRESGIELIEDMSFFRRLSMGLVADCRNQMSSKLNPLNVDLIHTANELNPIHTDANEAVDWSLSVNQNPTGPSNAVMTSVERSMSFTSHDSSCNIDSIFDLLIPFVFREGDLGWQARDAFLLVATYSNKDEDFSYSLAQNSSVCPVIATGLATLYAELPRELISNNYPQSWPELIQTVEEREQMCKQFAEFYSALEFCESILEVAHPLIQSSLLQFIHSGFFVSVLGFALTKPNVLEVITATVLLKEILVRTTNSAILPALLRFLLTKMPEEKRTPDIKGLDQEPSNESTAEPIDSHTQSSSPPVQKTSELLPTASTYMDLLISRLHYCNTLLGVATLSLFNTILNLNCEDVMFYLVLRHLVPFRDALFALGWSWPEPNTFVRASDDFLNLIASYQYGSSNRRRRWTSSASSEVGSLNGSVAELNLDEDLEPAELTSNSEATGLVTDSVVTSEVTSFSPVRATADTVMGLPSQSGFLNPREVAPNTLLPVRSPTATLMPVHSENFSSPVMNGVDQVIDMNETRMDQLKYLFRRRKPQSDGPQSPIGITPNDWLKYTNWARESIQRRVHACTSWRLVFDAIYPSAAQMAQFELSWNQSDAKERNGDISEDENPSHYDSFGKSNSDVIASHKRFKCFVNHNTTTLNEKQKQGERTAQAIHSAVAKLDLDTELDLSELDEPSDQGHDVYRSPYHPVNSTESEECATKLSLPHPLNSTEALLPNRDQQSNSITNVNGVGTYKNVSLNQMKRSGSNFSEDDADSTDSGCLVTETRFTQESQSGRTSLPTSTSKRNLTPVRPHNASLFNSSAVKSWYRLNFLESDFSDHIGENESVERVQILSANSSNELHEVDLTEHGPTSTPKKGRSHIKESINLNNPDVRALLDASKSEDFEQFVQRLEDVHCASLDDVECKQKTLSTDLQSYAVYFDHVLNDENDHKTSLNGLTPLGPCLVHGRKASNCSKLDADFDCHAGVPRNHHQTDDMKGKSSITNNTFSTSSSSGANDQDLSADNPTQVHTEANHWLLRSTSYQPNITTSHLDSTATHYLGGLTRRHSAQEADKVGKSEVFDGTGFGAGYGSDYLNPTNIPNLGPFLTTIIARLESLPHNCFYANLYLTSILSSLASYSQPLLRAIILLLPPNTPNERCHADHASTESAKPEDLSRWRSLREAYSQLPYAVLCSVRKQLDLFSIQYTMCPPDGMTISFMGLVMDAKQYFRHANEVPCPFTSSNHLPNKIGEAALTNKQSWRSRVSFFRRIFSRSKKNDQKSSQNKPRPGPTCMEESTPNRVSVTLSPHAYPQPGRRKLSTRQVSIYTWLPEVGLPSHASLMETTNINPVKSPKKKLQDKILKQKQQTPSRLQRRQSKQNSVLRRSNSTRSDPGDRDKTDWPTVQRMVLCAVIFEEFCKEMAALCIEHSVRS